jgi:hypothetical protein
MYVEKVTRMGWVGDTFIAAGDQPTRLSTRHRERAWSPNFDGTSRVDWLKVVHNIMLGWTV